MKSFTPHHPFALELGLFRSAPLSKGIVGKSKTKRNELWVSCVGIESWMREDNQCIWTIWKTLFEVQFEVNT